jgi:hypothetical protein
MSETQNVESSNKQFESKNSFEPQQTEASVPEVLPESPVTTSENEASVQKTSSDNQEGELPEFAKRRLGKEQKKYERDIGRLRAELEQERARNASANVATSHMPPGQQGYNDPLTGKFIDITTPEGQAIYNYQQELSQKITADDKFQQERSQKEIESKLRAHLEDSADEAREKYPDYDKVLRHSGINDYTTKELANFPDPAGLAYYLASNTREVERLQRLPAYELRRELARHMAEMVLKKNVTRTPAPVNPIGATGVQPAKHFAHKTLADLKAERRAQLSGQSKRR